MGALPAGAADTLGRVMSQKIPLVFGSGLDRATGVMAVEPASMEDLRNVLTREGKVQVRRGLNAVSELAGMTDVLAITSFRGRQRGAQVAWDSASRGVKVFRSASNGTGPVEVGDWFTAAPRVGLPRAVIAESYRRLFFAHEFPELEVDSAYARASTMVYDPDVDPPFYALELDLGGGEEEIRFRGVASWLNYLVGWGYGNANTEDRPELARISRPGQPDVFDPDAYFIAGHQGDPIIAGAPAGSLFVLFKEAETYRIIGKSARTFGIELADPRFGCVSARAAVNVSGACFFWSLEGPRVTEGQQSQDLAIPLDLGGPSPEDLVASGDAARAFALYLPVDRVVIWCFPSASAGSTRVYALSVRGAPEWGYWEFGQRVLAGTVFFIAGDLPPEGQPEFNEAATSTATFSATIAVDHVGANGDEELEVWLRKDGDADYFLHGTVPVVLDPDPQLYLTSTTLENQTQYDVALRHRRGEFFNLGAESSDPGDWPAASRGSIETEPIDGFLHASCQIQVGEPDQVIHEGSWQDDDAWEIWESSASSPEAVPGLGSAVKVNEGASGTSGGPDPYDRAASKETATYYRLWLYLVTDDEFYPLRDIEGTEIVLNDFDCLTDPVGEE